MGRSIARALAELAFQHNQADALNHIVHPAVIAAEEEWMRGVFADGSRACRDRGVGSDFRSGTVGYRARGGCSDSTN